MTMVETLTFRAPSGTLKALTDIAAKEGRKPSEIAREALATRLGMVVDKAAA